MDQMIGTSGQGMLNWIFCKTFSVTRSRKKNEFSFLVIIRAQ